jgi:hypothetical protein
VRKRGIAVLPLVAAWTVAGAHSASDAYLTLTLEDDGKSAETTLHGQWDIALRDLDFAIRLDDDGDGQLTWGEVKRHRAAIERYAYGQLKFEAAGVGCAIKPLRQMVDGHADGSYAALYFDVVCIHAPKLLTMQYTLFFPIDPSHRGIFVAHAGRNISTAVLSPQNAKIVLQLDSR